MTAAIALASTSVIAIDRAISQPRRSADIIPFPAKSAEHVAEALDVTTGNDADQDIETAIEPASGPATAMIDRVSFTKAVEIVERVTERRSTTPILSNLRIAAAGTNIAVTATDQDIDITVTTPAAIDSHFATTLPAKLLKDLLKKATASDLVAITTDDGRDTLDFERVDYSLQSLPAEDFPSLTPPSADQSAVFTMSGADFWDGLDCTMGAISTEETRYYLNGIFFHVYEHGDAPQLRMVATDGHRLYRRDFAITDGAVGMEGVIIPRKTVTLLHGMLKGKGCPAKVKIEVSPSRMRFTFDNVSVTSKTVDGTFPDYMRVIPTNNDKLASFDAAGLAESIRAVTLISSERSKAVKMTMSHDSARLLVNNPDAGSSRADVRCDYHGDEIEIGFNANYLGEILTIVGEKVSVAMADAGSPTLITGTRHGFTAVLMPMRV